MHMSVTKFTGAHITEVAVYQSQQRGKNGDFKYYLVSSYSNSFCTLLHISYALTKFSVHNQTNTARKNAVLPARNENISMIKVSQTAALQAFHANLINKFQLHQPSILEQFSTSTDPMQFDFERERMWSACRLTNGIQLKREKGFNLNGDTRRRLLNNNSQHSLGVLST